MRLAGGFYKEVRGQARTGPQIAESSSTRPLPEISLKQSPGLGPLKLEVHLRLLCPISRAKEGQTAPFKRSLLDRCAAKQGCSSNYQAHLAQLKILGRI